MRLVRRPNVPVPTSWRGFTLLEVIIVIVIAGILMAFALPRLLSANTLGVDQQAKTTASGILNTVVALHAAAADRTWPTVDDPASDEPEDRKHVPPAPDVSAATMRPTNPDARLVDRDTDPSTDANVASVGRAVNNPGAPEFWRVGIAVYSPATEGTSGGGSCWYGLRDIEPPVAGQPIEHYLVLDLPDDTHTTRNRLCRGDVAAHLTVPPQNDPNRQVQAGRAWSAPIVLTLPEANAAALDAAADTVTGTLIEPGGDIQ